ncbi:MAG: hypothetical protein HFG79_01740 [Lachnospiraceae bacterium]|nr:hypothetical protein [Lachnospiraceae bacterium]
MKKITRLFKIMRKYQKKIMILKVLIAVLQGIVISLNVSFTRSLVDNMIGYVQKTASIKQVVISGLILGVTILLDVVFVYFNSVLDVECEKMLTNTLEPEFIDKFCKLPYKTFEDNESKNIIQRASDSPYLKMRSVFVNMMNIVQMILLILGIGAVYRKLQRTFLWLNSLLCTSTEKRELDGSLRLRCLICFTGNGR